jgi:hypothetical protein
MVILCGRASAPSAESKLRMEKLTSRCVREGWMQNIFSTPTYKAGRCIMHAVACPTRLGEGMR